MESPCCPFGLFRIQSYLVLWLVLVYQISLCRSECMSEAHLKCSSLELAGADPYTCESSASADNDCRATIQSDQASEKVIEWVAAEREGAWIRIRFLRLYSVTKVIIQQRAMESAQIRRISIDFDEDPKMEVILSRNLNNETVFDEFSFPAKVTKNLTITVLAMYSSTGGNPGFRTIKAYDENCDRGYQASNVIMSRNSLYPSAVRSWTSFPQPFLKIHVSFLSFFDVFFAVKPTVLSDSYRIRVSEISKKIVVSKGSSTSYKFLGSGQCSIIFADQKPLWFLFNKTHVVVGAGYDEIFLAVPDDQPLEIKYVGFTSASPETAKVMLWKPVGSCYDSADYYWLADKALGGTTIGELRKGSDGKMKMDADISERILPYGPIVDGLVSSALYLSGTRNSGVTLGKFHDGCLSDITLCTKGVTIGFWISFFGLKFPSSRKYFLFLGGDYSTGISMYAERNSSTIVSVLTPSACWTAQLDFDRATWYHVVILWNLSEGLKVLVNNVIKSVGVRSACERGASSGFMYLRLGTDGVMLSRNGRVAFRDVAVWERALSVTEIRQTYHCNNYGVSRELAANRACKQKTIKGECCHFPFIYKGKKYGSCTTIDNGDTPWCGTTANRDISSGWDNCQILTGIIPFPEQNVAAVGNGGYCSDFDSTVPAHQYCNSLIDGSTLTGYRYQAASSTWVKISFAESFVVNVVEMQLIRDLEKVNLTFSDGEVKEFKLVHVRTPILLFDDKVTSSIKLDLFSTSSIYNIKEVRVKYSFSKDRISSRLYNLAKFCSVYSDIHHTVRLHPLVTDNLLTGTPSSLAMPSNPPSLDKNNLSPVMIGVHFPRIVIANVIRLWMDFASSDHLKIIEAVFSDGSRFTFHLTSPDDSANTYAHQFLFTATKTHWVHLHVMETHGNIFKKTNLREIEVFYDTSKDLQASYTIVDQNGIATSDTGLANVRIGPFDFIVAAEVRVVAGPGDVLKRSAKDFPDYFKLYIQSSGVICVDIGGSVFCSVGLVTDGQWHDVKVCYNAMESNLMLYLDGRLDESITVLPLSEVGDDWDWIISSTAGSIRNFKVHHSVQGVGIETMKIQDSAMTASSSLDAASGPEMARLNGASSWDPSASDDSPYLQLDLGIPKNIIYLGFQANTTGPLLVQVSYSNGSNWLDFNIQNNEPQVIAPETHGDNTALSSLYRTVVGRFLRLQFFRGSFAPSRVEVYEIDYGLSHNSMLSKHVPTYSGCLAREGLIEIFNFPTLSYDTQTTTPSTCQTACYQDGFPNAALYHESVCFCLADGHDQSYLSNDLCSSPCTGNAIDRCGGKSHVSVYVAMASNLIPTSRTFAQNVTKTFWEIISEPYVPVSTEVTMTLNSTGEKSDIVDVSFNAVFYESMKFTPGSFHHTFATTGDAYVVAEERPLTGGSVVSTFTRVSVVREIYALALFCPEYHADGELYSCSSALQKGSHLNTSCFLDDEELELDIEDTMSATTGRILAAYPGTATSIVNSTTVLPASIFLEKGPIVAFDFMAAETGSITIQIYRPTCADPQVYCYTLSTCVPASEDCPRNNPSRTDVTFPTTDNLCDLRDPYCPRINPQRSPPGDLTLVFEQTFEVLHGGPNTVIPKLFYPNVGDLVAFTNSDILVHRAMGTVLYKDGVVSGLESTLPLLSLTLVANRTPMLRAHYSVASGIVFNLNKTGELTCNLSNPVNGLTNSKIIKKLVPIENVTLVYHNVSATNEIVIITIPPHPGTMASFVLQYGDGAKDEFQRNDDIDNLNKTLVFNHAYTAAGNVKLNLTGSNPISTFEKTYEIQILDAVEGVELPCVFLGKTGESVTLSWTATKGHNASVDIHFGDGTSETLGPYDLQPSMPYSVQHVYETPGVLNLSVTVMNAVSLIKLTGEVYLFAPIENVTAEVDPPSGFVDKKVTVAAQVSQGTDPRFSLTFRCQRTGSVLLHDEFMNGTLEMIFSKPCLYDFYLLAYNNVSGEWLNGTLNIESYIIENLTISVPVTALSELSRFTAEVDSGLGFNCSWNFGDNTVIVTPYSSFGQPVNHTYPSVGNYTVRVSCSNNISSANASTVATVIKLIKSVEIIALSSGGEDSKGAPVSGPVTEDSFPLENPVVFKFVADGTDVSYNVEFGDLSKSIITLNSSVEHSFVSPGTYVLTVNASNALSYKVQSISVTLVASVLDVQISNDGPVKVGSNATFVATIGQLGTASCFYFNLGDGTELLYKDTSTTTCAVEYQHVTVVRIIRPKSKTITFTHEYPGASTYHVTCAGSNSVSSSTSTTQVDVTELLCLNPDVNIENLGNNVSEPREFMRSEDFEMLSKNTIDCEATSVTKFIWEVFRVVESKFAEDAKVVLPTDIVADDWKLVLKSRSLDYGVYKVTFTLIMVGVTGVNSSTFGYFKVTPSPLVAEVRGGSARTVGFNKLIPLDGGASRDPDVEEGNFEGMSFFWSCKRSDDNYTFPDDPQPLESTKNAKDSVDRGGCFSNGPGRMNYSTSTSEINLDTGLMRENSSYVIQLLVIKDTRRSSFYLHLNIIQGNPPTVALTCLKNCFPKFNPSMKVSIEVTCQDCKLSSSFNYHWSVFVGGDVEDEWVLLDNSSDTILTKASSPNVVIRDGALEGKRILKIQAEVWRPGGIPGIAEFIRPVNTPPSGGRCWVSPALGFALDTSFSVSCDGWMDDNEPLRYSFSYVNGPNSLESLLYVGESSRTSNFTFPIGQSYNSTLNVIVSVSDSFGASTSVTITVQVKPSSVKDGTLLSTIGSLASPNGTIETLVASGDTQGAMQYISTLCSMLNFQSTNEGTGGTNGYFESTPISAQSEEGTKIRTNLANIISGTAVGTLDDAHRTSATLHTVTVETTQVSAEAQDKIISTLETVGNFLVSEADKPQTDPETVEKAAAAVLSSVGNVMVAAFSVVDTARAEDTFTFEEDEKKEATNLESESSDEADAKKKVEEEKREEDLGNAWLSVVTSVSKAVVRNKAPGESPTRIESSHLSLEVHRENAEDLDQKVLSAGSGTFILPKFGGYLNGTGEVDIATVASTYNPYPDTVNRIHSLIMTTELRNASGVIPVSDLEDPIDIRLPRPKNAVPSRTLYEIRANRMAVHKFRMKHNDSSISIDLYPTGNCSERANFSFFLRRDRKPSYFVYDFNATIPEEVSFRKTGRNTTKNPNTFFLSNVDLNRTAAGLYYLGIRYNRPDASCPDVMNYTIDFYTSGCLYWNVDRKSWQCDGCWVGPLTNLKEIQCLCNHLTSFGGDFAVAPNAIDWDAVGAGFSNLSDNPVVFATVLSIIGLYFILLVWTRRLDKKDLDEFVTIPLPDNDPRDTYNYEVVVYTGHSKYSGTTAKVMLVIVGNRDETEPRALVDPSNSSFKAGGVNTFVLSVPSTLGRLSHIRVWHDNTGESPSWYLSRILIRDLQTDRKTWFLCDQWLAVEEDDGLIVRVLPPATRDDLVSFNFLFSIEARRKLFDDHLWFSVLARRPRSQFTRAQRLSCCLSVLLSSMLANAMFYQVDDASSSGNEVRAGPIVFSAKQLWIAFISSMVVLPVNLLIVYLYRNVRARNHGDTNTEQEMLDNDEEMVQRSEDDEAEIITEATKPTNSCSKNSLPPRFVYVAHFLVFLTVSVSATFTIFYGFTFGKEKSERWISSTMMSFFQDLLLSQPLKVFAAATFIALIVKDPNKVDEGDKNDDKRELAEQVDDPVREEEETLYTNKTRRPRTPRSVMKPPDEADLVAVREFRQKQKTMRGIVSEICWYLAYLTLISIVAYGNRDPKAYHVTRAMNDMFVENKYSSRLSSSDVSNVPKYWSWLYNSILPAMSTPYWYGPYGLEDIETMSKTSASKSRGKAKTKSSKTKSSGVSDSDSSESLYDYPRGFTADRAVSYIVGQARARQLRNARQDSCHVHPAVQHMHQACSKEYSWSNEDEGCYGVNWTPVNESIDECRKSNPDSHWVYHTALDLKGTPFWGKFHNYWGGGFVVGLGSTLSDIQEETKRLEEEGWIDEHTRAVFLEFTIYNGFTNFFCAVTLLVEKQNTGGLYPYTQLNTLRLYNYVGPEAFVTLVCEIIFVGVLFYNTYREVKEARNRGIRNYFREPWNYFDILGLVCSFSAVALYFVRIAATSVALKNINEHSRDFVSFHYVSAVDQSFTTLMAFAIFVYFLKLLRLLRFNRKISLLWTSLVACTETLMGFLFVYMLLFAAYAQLMYTVYGRDLEDYSSYHRCLSSLMEMTLGATDFESLYSVNRVLTGLVFFSYTFLNVFVYMNLFISIISEKFSEVRADASLQANDHEIVDFMIHSLKKAFGNVVAPALRPIYREPKDNLSKRVEKIEDTSDCIQLAIQGLCKEDIRQTLWFKDSRKMEEKKLLLSILLETGELWTENDIGDAIPLFDNILKKFTIKDLKRMQENHRKKILEEEQSARNSLLMSWMDSVELSTSVGRGSATDVDASIDVNGSCSKLSDIQDVQEEDGMGGVEDEHGGDMEHPCVVEETDATVEETDENQEDWPAMINRINDDSSSEDNSDVERCHSDDDDDVIEDGGADVDDGGHCIGSKEVDIDEIDEDDVDGNSCHGDSDRDSHDHSDNDLHPVDGGGGDDSGSEDDVGFGGDDADNGYTNGSLEAHSPRREACVVSISTNDNVNEDV